MIQANIARLNGFLHGTRFNCKSTRNLQTKANVKNHYRLPNLQPHWHSLIPSKETFDT